MNAPVGPLRNRVDPFGDIAAHPARGLLMGNRGGRIHDPRTRTLTGRAWVSRQWICCALTFRDRRRAVMGEGYTELFFLDEVVAFAAGHRPCFQCRRAAADAFAAAWAKGAGTLSPGAGEMDRRLHAERLIGTRRRRHPLRLGTLPDGAVFVGEEGPVAVKDGRLLRWSFNGWNEMSSGPGLEETVQVLTPPSILGALVGGYQPLWHPSAMV
ncbi:hypothetical protein GCM10007301_45980 [Azorhizobium oxalatiphilum]|uniref:Uncharacterized protein n=1 Tax=Azorhizobium oxalatiphilum TaxID=980631 RepID=A0A917CAQ7_9HYPH|nr:hypothetical protein [Azorhizobium oxalatiphilum]GGF80682.1 hypothetical protein GCM10007301_45980 [Azorhizobium oxalatiphilum]